MDVCLGDASFHRPGLPLSPGLDAPRLTGVAAIASRRADELNRPYASTTPSSKRGVLPDSLVTSGDEGGIAGTSLAGRRMKLACVDDLAGVPPTSSTAGNVLLMNTSLWLVLGPVDGTRHPMLDGGTKSSVLSKISPS